MTLEAVWYHIYRNIAQYSEFFKINFSLFCVSWSYLVSYLQKYSLLIPKCFQLTLV